MTQTIEQLKARVAELEAELAQADCINGKVIAENGDLKELLILAQADNKRLRDALEYHQEQTRPIERTVEALSTIKESEVK